MEKSYCREALEDIQRRRRKPAVEKYVIYRLAFDADGLVDCSKQGEVIRCKDCKHRYVTGTTTQYYVCDFMDAQYNDDGFCHHAERRRDE